ncbi:PEPxxWA-CTERM sorting domain-containing protein [Gimibacter soli]|uniref:PEPxxWA-CTERM sorting domain-containing protein n=1 Tax=Gimibacter soli TaxID=3024400 RepID=A0AAF0BLD4_9PROT|nr:PEPxxWA-CTERM sorting domain-containing protein [Gimibacter soli]WCL54017.1 PEPxxWA-CTERM sorting domain-containing protein [Gimibacter soli]
MSVLKKAAAAALLATGLSVGAEAAVTTFVFSGEASYESEALAQKFGILSGTVGTFTATLKFDAGQTTTDAWTYSKIDPKPGNPFEQEIARYYYESFSWTLDDQSWSYDGSGVGASGNPNDVYVRNGIMDGTSLTHDSTYASGISDIFLVNGLSVLFSNVHGQMLDETFWPTANASNLFAFNEITDLNWGRVSTNEGLITLGNITMTVGGVPEPATWLTMIMGFGLAGVAVRRRRVACAVQ